MTNTRNEIKAQIIRASFWGKGRRTATACERPFSVSFAHMQELLRGLPDPQKKKELSL
ncbi:MAG: hypothetical protein IJV41_05905 [Oscillospiraceae bacterium]|nr:hypothetical protein [Oscillospiraceae bacterium]